MAKDSKTLVSAIKKQIRIVDLAEEHGISLNKISSGNFTHRCKCPNKNHKSGNENTDSLYIDSENNDFYCYGCSAGSSSIDFFMICNDVNFSEALSVMSDYIDDKSDLSDGYAVKRFDDFAIKLRISNVMRNFCQNNKKDYDYFSKLSLKIDDILEQINCDDYKKLSSLERQIEKHLKRRYV